MDNVIKIVLVLVYHRHKLLDVITLFIISIFGSVMKSAESSRQPQTFSLKHVLIFTSTYD
jgi:hypothetical protein